jgi:AcrR family transcriptional regulator
MPRHPGQIDEHKKADAVTAAIAAIAEAGTLAVPMVEVARRAGVSKQTIYNHHGGRAGLIAAVQEKLLTEQEVTSAHGRVVRLILADAARTAPRGDLLDLVLRLPIENQEAA